jgi:hypothetical protein
MKMRSFFYYPAVPVIGVYERLLTENF